MGSKQTVGYKSKDDPNPSPDEETFELALDNKLEYNEISYRVTNIDSANKKATVVPLIPSEGTLLEIDLDLATSLSEEYYKEP